eukprot:14835203-Alexandrium_andersonii.AAC.1
MRDTNGDKASRRPSRSWHLPLSPGLAMVPHEGKWLWTSVCVCRGCNDRASDRWVVVMGSRRFQRQGHAMRH